MRSPSFNAKKLREMGMPPQVSTAPCPLTPDLKFSLLAQKQTTIPNYMHCHIRCIRVYKPVLMKNETIKPRIRLFFWSKHFHFLINKCTMKSFIPYRAKTI